MPTDDDDRPDFREAADVPAQEEDNDDTEMGAGESDNDSGGLSGRVRDLRKRLAKRRSKKKAKSLKRKRKRRKATEPARERVQAASEEVEAASDEARLLAAELGVTTDRASEIADQAGGLLDRAAATGGDALAQLDTDGDGDSDILDAIEENVENSREDGTTDEFEPPVGDIEDDFDEVDLDGVEAELGVEEPIEDDFDGGLF